MGCLECQASGRRVTLGVRCLVGRASHCELQLDNPRVSGEHARLRYTRRRWVLRDLGSSNGTEVDGTPSRAGHDVPLRQGSAVLFGSRQERWVLVDDSAPTARARRGDGRVVVMEGGVLALPEPEAPECQVFPHRDSGWLVELTGGDTRLVSDQERLHLSDGAWRLELPPLLQHGASTTYDGQLKRTLESATLRFGVSHDRSHIELTVCGPDWQVALGARVYNEMLLVLAETRQRERRQHRDISAAEHGWLHADEVCRLAAVKDQRQIDQHVFHARHQLVRAGVEGAAELIDRRRKGQLRIGIESIEIINL